MNKQQSTESFVWTFKGWSDNIVRNWEICTAHLVLLRTFRRLR